jgi:hypothetical protein
MLSCAAFAEPREEKGAHWRISEEDRGALVDLHVAALKAGLKLTPMQEKNWPALEAAIREHAKAWAARIAEWHEKRKEHEVHQNAIEALQHRAKALRAQAAQLVKLRTPSARQSEIT